MNIGRKLTLVIVSASIYLSNAANADSIMRGAGVGTCGQFAKNYAADPQFAENLFFGWAQGFMSAMNYALSASKNRIFYHDLGAPTDEQMANIRNYCNAHPLASYHDAVMDLYQSLPVKAQ